MQNWMIFVGGAGLGARMMYLLDPARGRKRRAITRDRTFSRARRSMRYLDVSRRDMRKRFSGVLARGRSRVTHVIHPESGQTSDDILRERIRAKLGRYVSHPHAIQLVVEGGRVLLRGPILEKEARHAVHAVYRVPGVREVVDLLETHRKADVPELRGGTPRPGERADILQDSWAPSTRLLAGIAGSGAMFFSAGARPEPWARIAGVLGGVSVLRAVTNRSVHELLGFGRRRSMKVHKTINIGAPLEQVFIFWSDFRNFPKFMTDIYEVRVSDDGLRSYWKVAGPAGAPLTFESYVTRYEPNRVIAWKTIRPSVLPNSGTIQFSETEGGTRIDIEFSYLPPGGALAEVAARVFGADPKSRLDESLAQMKTLLEQGPSERQLRRLL